MNNISDYPVLNLDLFFSEVVLMVSRCKQPTDNTNKIVCLSLSNKR